MTSLAVSFSVVVETALDDLSDVLRGVTALVVLGLHLAGVLTHGAVLMAIVHMSSEASTLQLDLTVAESVGDSVVSAHGTVVAIHTVVAVAAAGGVLSLHVPQVSEEGSVSVDSSVDTLSSV